MLQAGELVGRYHILRRLADGGMGTLYLAHDPILDRDIALKLFLGDIDLPGARERFVREARAAAGLSNPNIVTVYDYGDSASRTALVAARDAGQPAIEDASAHPEALTPETGEQLAAFRPSPAAFAPSFINFFLASPARQVP